MGSRQPRLLALAAGLLALAAGAARAEVVRDGSLGDAPAGVVPSGIDPNGQFATYLITPELGAARPEANPRNLFHSFSEFDLVPGEIATFTGPASVVNIFGRVTTPKSSEIDGLVRSTADGANLFLLNPYGVVFGADAELDVQGSFYASSADVMRFEDESEFPTGVPTDGVHLTDADPSAFGFLRSAPGDIEVARANPTLGDGWLSVPAGQTLGLVGGDVRVAGRGFNVPTVLLDGGSFEVASVAGPAEVPLEIADLDVGALEPDQLGSVEITEKAIVDVSELFEGAGGGRVVIRGGTLVIDQQSLVTTATLLDADAPEVGVDMAVTGDVLLSGVTDLPDGEQNTLIRTTSLQGAGRGGDIAVSAGRFVARDGARIETESVAGSGRGGDLTIAAGSVRVESDARVATTTGFAGFGSGRGGDLTIAAGSIEVAGGVVRTETLSAGRGGDLHLAADDDVYVEGEVSALGAGGPGGDLEIEAQQVAVRSGGLVTTQAFGDDDAGNIAIHTGTLSVSGSLSGVQAFGAAGAAGGAGSIEVRAEDVELTDGGVLTVSAQGDGGAGTIDVEAEDLLIEGVDANANRAGIYANAISGARGDAGQIDVRLGGGLTIQDGGQVSATSTSDLGGQPGSIRIAARTVEISNSDEAIRAESLSSSDAGTIEITASRSVKILDTDGVDTSITTQANLAGGGDIRVSAGRLILLRRSVGDPTLDPSRAMIRANVLGVGAKGGNVSLAAPNVILDRAGVVANAERGEGGSIAIDTRAFFVPEGRLEEVSAGRFVAAEDTFLDVSGELDEKKGKLVFPSPVAAVVAQIAALDEDFLDVTALVTDQCAAREERVGSLVVRGRDRSPAPPGDELRSFYLDERGSAD